MRFSFKIARLLGIDIRVHALFVALFLWMVFEASGAGILELAAVVTGFLGAFLCVLLHELGHCVVARRKGIRVLDITLWPLGGIARLEGMPDEPRDEFAIAIAGPLVNFAIAAALLPILLAYRPISQLLDVQLRGGNILHAFLAFNLGLGLFNLIPAFPMDGGRILRAFLARRRNHLDATRLATRVGRFVAFVGIVYGIWVAQWIYVILALFVWFSGSQELLYARMRDIQRRASSVGSPEAPAGEFDRFPGEVPVITPERRAALEAALERLRRQRGE